MGFQLYATFREVKENRAEKIKVFQLRLEFLKIYCVTNSGFQEVELRFRRVERVLGFFSSRRKWDSPTPSPFGSGGGYIHSLVGEGLGCPNLDEGTDTLVL